MDFPQSQHPISPFLPMHSTPGPSHQHRRSPVAGSSMAPLVTSPPALQQRPYTVVDCTHSNANLHNPAGASSSSTHPGVGTGRRTASGDISLPEWQPDANVKQCPLCTGGFTFWNRRHHCRTCGRVVCSTCSPHRIRIPKAFVVRPPETYVQTDPAGLFGEITSDEHMHPGRSVSWSGDGSELSRQLSSSGEEDDGMQVRVCDECLGKQGSGGGQRSVSGPLPGYLVNAGANFGGFSGLESGRGAVPGQNGRSEIGTRRRRQNSHAGRSAPHSHGLASSGSRPYISPHQHVYYHHQASSSQHSPSWQQGTYSSHVPLPNPAPPLQYASASNQPPRPDLSETDYCPICTRPLPPPNPHTGSEEAREAHIEECIRLAESGVSPRTRQSAEAPTQSENSESVSRALRYTGGGRMVVWKATEKDTWAFDSGTTSSSSSSSGEKEDGEEKEREKAECVICFEEFEVGDVIARLECLCRYHKKCIREWFDRKGTGECPIHAMHE